MTAKRFTPRTALVVFYVLAFAIFAQATWWVIFMARITDEKVDIADKLGADSAYLEELHDQERHRQIMIGSEGVFFLVLTAAGAWLGYRALRRSEELKFHQQNFLMAVTHELKTPLAALKVYLDTLTSTRIPDEKKREIIPKMRKDVAKLETMVANILEAGRFERGGFHPDSGSVDLGALARRALERLAGAPDHADVQIEEQIADNVQIDGDDAALGRALDAILDNAIRYNPGPTPAIALSVRRTAAKCLLSVSDNGAGIDPDDLHRVFERFYRGRSEASHNRSGSGLGLYLAREIVRSHGGDISASSAGPDQGTTITIELPVKT